MTFLVDDSLGRHDDLQAALSFVDDYDFSLTDDVTCSQQQYISTVDDAQDANSNGSSNSFTHHTAELEPLDDFDILEISTFVDQHLQMQQQQQQHSAALVPLSPVASPTAQPVVLQPLLPSAILRTVAAVPSAMQRSFRPVIARCMNNSNNRLSVSSPSPSVQSDSSSSSSSSSSIITTAIAKPAPAKKPVTWDPNKARNERKGELVYLRQQVAGLEAQLSNIRSTKKPRLSPQIHPTLTVVAHKPVAKPSNSAAVTVWKALASRQRDKRAQSERENVRLKLVLENQLKIAKSLEDMILKKATTKDIEKTAVKKHLTHIYAPSPDRSDSATFEELLAGIQAAHKETDAVFTANGLAHSETRSDAKVRQNGSNGIYLEVFAGKILPFDTATTSDAVWTHFANPHERRPYRHYYNELASETQVPTDTLMESLNMVLYANKTSAVFKVKRILRRYVEATRVVIVWWAFIDPIELSDEPLAGVRFLEKGYIVIQQPTSMGMENDQFALLQTCYITTPVFTGEWTQDDHPRVGAITDFVLSSTEANISASHQMIEDVLLQQAMRG